MNSIFCIIGFISGYSYASTNNSLTSNCSVNFGGITRLNVKSTSFYSSNIDSFTGKSNNILCNVPITSPNNGYIYFENFTNYKSIFNGKCINSITIEIIDDLNNYVDFNYLDFSITLQIDMLRETIHDYNNIDDLYNSEKSELEKNELK